MIHPATERRFVSDEVGHGVFATQFIPKGTIVWTLSSLDTRFTPEEVADMPADFYPFMEIYPYIDRNGDFILGCDIDIYCNHSCDPPLHNIGSTDVAIAIRNIQANEEITYDYATNNIIHDLYNCRCGAKDCRGTISSSDLLAYSAQWESKVKNILPFVRQVEQPLYQYIIEKQEFDNIIDSIIPVPPYTDFLCPPEVVHKLKVMLGIAINSQIKEKIPYSALQEP